jgi:hypothetical protein
MMSENYLAPCGAYCGTCKFLNREETPNCSGCGSQEGLLFWGNCKVYACAEEHRVNHCGDCEAFPCDLFVDQYDPSHGPKSAFTRAGLLAYRKKAGNQKYIEIAMKLEEEKES